MNARNEARTLRADAAMLTALFGHAQSKMNLRTEAAIFLTTVYQSYHTLLSSLTTMFRGSTTMFRGSTTMFSDSTTMFSGSTTMLSGSTTMFSGSTTMFSGSTTMFSGSTTMFSGSTTMLSGLFGALVCALSHVISYFNNKFRFGDSSPPGFIGSFKTCHQMAYCLN